MTSQSERDATQEQDGTETPVRESGYLTNGSFSRFLELKRAQATQKEPFRGFNSPPGRF